MPAGCATRGNRIDVPLALVCSASRFALHLAPQTPFPPAPRTQPPTLQSQSDEQASPADARGAHTLSTQRKSPAQGAAAHDSPRRARGAAEQWPATHDCEGAQFTLATQGAPTWAHAHIGGR
jgi:hypothetical protein